MRTRHRLGKLLLRHGVRYEGEGGAIDALVIRRDQLEATIAELIADSPPWARDVARLRCMRGIDRLTAVGLCAEGTPFERFEHPRQLMSYLGLDPSENSTGQTRRQGAITRSGSQHARRLLIEAAWHCRRPHGSARRSRPAKPTSPPPRPRSP